MSPCFVAELCLEETKLSLEIAASFYKLPLLLMDLNYGTVEEVSIV